jgi:hypothetical protein
MKEKKIVKAIIKLDAYELNSFKKFLLSPFFNLNEKCIAYFDLFHEAIKDERDLSSISNEEIWKHTFGEVMYEDVKLRKLSSDLYNLYDDFIVQKQLEQEKANYLSLKLKAYRNRNIKELYTSVIVDAEQTDKIVKDRNAEYYLHKYTHQRFILDINVEGGIVSRREDLDAKLNIEEVSYYLDVFYIAEKLKYYCTLLSWKRNYNINKKIAGIDVILKLAQSEIFNEYPPIIIYYTIAKTFTEEDNTDHYFKLKELIDKYLHLFSEDESKEIIELTINYALTKGNKGHKEFEKECLELYKRGLESNLLFEDGLISPSNFRNITFYALRLGEYEWAEYFIEEYAKILPESVRESNVNFSLARVEFYKQNYSKVIQHLAYTEYTEVFQALLSRTLLLLSYYELNETESLESLLSSFKLYLDREKTWTKQRKTQYYNLIKFLKTLSKTENSKEKLFKLKEDVTATSAVVNKAWLLEKIEEKLKSGR